MTWSLTADACGVCLNPGPFGNVLGIMYNRHYLDILANGGGALQAILSEGWSRACRRSVPSAKPW